MAKLYYKHGAMKSGKSVDLIRSYTSYVAQGKEVLAIKPSTDTRSEGIKSRLIGDHVDAVGIEPRRFKDSIHLLTRGWDVILIDEGQFLKREDVEVLKMVTIQEDIPIIVYGLKNDFRNNLFEGSEALLIFADSISEIKSVCQYCNSKATMNLRLGSDGKGTTSGTQVQVGDEEYIPVCSVHYFENI